MSVRELSRLGLIEQVVAGTVTQLAAAQALGTTDRQVRRLTAAYRDKGAAGLVHAARGKPGNRRITEEFRQNALRLVAEKYADFGPTLAAEKLLQLDRVAVGAETLRLWMVEKGLWKPSRRKPAHRERRERRPVYGQMGQFDGSCHAWFEGRGPKCCLLASIDDADNRVDARFGESEGIVPVFGFWKRRVETAGVPLSIYLDRGGTYKVNHPTALDDPELLTQFGRAMRDLGSRLIFAHSPQAKGRVERLFETLQDRLVKDLRLAGISTVDGANAYLEETFLPAFNRKFMKAAAGEGDAHRTLSAEERESLPSVFSVHSVRTVRNDFTVQFRNQLYQLRKTQPCLVLPKARVTVEERLDGSLHMRLDRHLLGFDPIAKADLVPTRLTALTSNPNPRVHQRPDGSHPWRRFTFGQGVPPRLASAAVKPDISILEKTGHF